MPKELLLYWWSERHIQKKDHENYGDLLGAYLVTKISGRPVKWVRAAKPGIKNYFKPVHATIGSILSHLGKKTTVWGCGINHRDERIVARKLLAVRGPLSRKRALENNLACPAIYGDPALLLPVYYQPVTAKTYTVGIIPHIVDVEMVKKLYENQPEVAIIDFRTNNVEQTTDAITSCAHILSSSLHGIIVAHAYGIPAVQVRFSDRIHGDGVKYHDYLLAVGLEAYEPETMTQAINTQLLLEKVQQHPQNLPNPAQIATLQQGLLAVCPFKKTA